MKTRFLIVVSLVFMAVAIVLPSAGEASDPIMSVDLVFTAEDFETGLRENLIITEAGMSLAPTAISGRYISPVVETPIPFNAIVPHWTADIPYTNNLRLMVRTGVVGGDWGDWYQVYENHDWMDPEDEESVGQMIAVPAVDVTHDKLQYAVFFSRYTYAPSAVLKQLRYTIIDSTDGPTVEEMLEQVSELEDVETPDGQYPKPGVIPRSIWCNNPACNYSDGLAYESVSHLIVHHTVSSNSSSDWAAIVRAIWHYHTFTRNWGDIGYNYLVDMNGVLYEGHNGGDDVVGTHAAGANKGSMALSFIGTFTEPHQSPPGITPPQPMLNSAAELFAWKADHRDIDVYSASRLPNVDWGLPHLMGHRDVYGTTACPGDQAHDLLPWLRDEVANRIGFVSPHLYVDEQSSAFSKSSSGSWYTPPGGCGFDGHAFYTWSETDPSSSTNWGEWRPNISNSGAYKVEAYAPFCVTGRKETDGAVYSINHANGSRTISVSQEDNLGTWMNLGTYYFNSGNSGVIRLTDLSSTDSGLGVWFDAIRLRPLDPNLIPEISITSPTTGSWKLNRTVSLEWDVENAVAVETTKIRIASDPGFNNEILNETFSGARTSFTYTFPHDYETLYWRVVMRTYEGHAVGSNVDWFGIDTNSPSSQVQGVVKIGDRQYGLNWSGNDSTSGIATYLVQYRAEGETYWRTLLANTTQTSAGFFPDDGRVYWFRTQATDQAGNSEAANPSGDMSTSQAIQLHRVIISPLIFR